jgi:hypothetical protein
MLRFAILKTVDGQEKVCLEYTQSTIIARLQARLKENLSALEKPVIKKTWLGKEVIIGTLQEWTIEEVLEQHAKAFDELVNEFKQGTCKLA